MSRALLVLTVLLPILGSCSAATRRDVASDGAIDVMTFNIRFAHPRPPNLWPDRLPVMVELIERWEPDLIGTQEGLYSQLVDLEARLPEYAWIGLGREGGTRGEFMAVYYRRDRFDALEYDHYWLSDTPEVIGSKSWGNQIPRMVTWVRFRDRETGKEFVFVNTHFDHQSQPARERSAELLAQRMERWGPEVPVIVVGDFNAAAGSNPAYDRLLSAARLTDTWRALSIPDTLGTFHNFQGIPTARPRPRIDWILTRGPVEPVSSEIVTYARNGQFPSDHFPVVARLRIQGTATR